MDLNFQIYTMYVNRRDLLLNAIHSMDRYANRIVVLDNSPGQQLTLDGFAGEIYRPEVPLFCAQSYHLILNLALRRRQEVFFIMHSDALASNEVIEQTLARAEELNQRGETWGVLFTLYDVLCLCNTQAIQDIRWDLCLPLYFTDADYYRRLRLAGIPILETGLTVGHQEGGSATLRADPALAEFIHTNFPGWQEYYKRKWGGEPGHETYQTAFNAVLPAETAAPEEPPQPPSPEGRIEVTIYAGSKRAAAQTQFYEGVQQLAERHAFPAEKPGVAPLDQGWLQGDTAFALARRLSKETSLVVELGSWLGRSTRYLADCAPRAAVIAIDHWLGSEEQRACREWQDLLPVLYETFLVNCWACRDRIFPVRLTTLEGLRLLKQLDIAPELIYVDASHDYESVRQDVRTALMLFPDAVLVGDDWFAPDVERAVREIVAEGRLESRFGFNVTAWWIDRP